MKKRIVLVVVALLVLTCALTACGLVHVSDNTRQYLYIDSNSDDGIDSQYIAANTVPAVVQTRAEFSDGSVSAGAGFFINADGYILTNRHCVVKGDSPSTFTPAKRVYYSMGDNQYYVAELVNYSTTVDLDLAVLKPAKLVGSVPFLAFDDAVHPDKATQDSARIEYGQPCFAIGNPENLGLFFSRAMIANPQYYANYALGKPTSEPALLVDCNINHGNSGGPLVDVNSKVIGVIYARIESESGSAFASSNEVYGIGCAIPCYRATAYLDTVSMKGLSGQKYYYDYPAAEQ